MKLPFYKKIFIGLVALRAFAYWIALVLLRHGEPLSVGMIYRERGQDIEYFPYVSALMLHGFHDAYDYIHHGTGVLSFPFGSVWLHSLLFDVMGPLGFAFADAAVAIASFFLISSLFQQFKIAGKLADTLSLCMVIGLAGKIAGISAAVRSAVGSTYPLLEMLAFIVFIATAIWTVRKSKSLIPVLISGSALVFLIAHDNWEYFTWRFPRPFVSGVYFAAYAILLMKLLQAEKLFHQKKVWLLLGVVAAFVLQSDIYTFLFCGLLTMTLVLARLRQNFSIPDGLKSLSQFLMTFIPLSVPFIIQRMHENPEVPRRYGMYEISRLHPYFLEFNRYHLFLLCVIAVLSWFALKLKNEKPLVGAISGSYLFTLFLMPIFIFLTGKVILPGHFYDLMKHMSTLLVILSSGLVLTKIFQSFTITVQQKKFVFVGIIALSFANIAKDTHKTLQFADHTRSDFEEYSRLPNYKANFTELVKLLEQPRFSPDLSMATFDMQTSIWWMTFKRGKNFVSDNFSSSLSDKEIEDRLNVMSHLLSFSPEKFVRMMRLRSTNIFFSTGCKFQFNKGRQLSTLDDYLPEDLERYKTTSEISAFNIALPISEQRRLTVQYLTRKIPEPKDTPDLILLQKYDLWDENAADPARYSLIFSNEVFRLWKKN